MREETKRQLVETIDTFDILGPRLVVTPKGVLIDNVKKVVMVSEGAITVSHGYSFSSVAGRHFVIKEIADERMIIQGEIEKIEIFRQLSNSSN